MTKDEEPLPPLTTTTTDSEVEKSAVLGDSKDNLKDEERSEDVTVEEKRKCDVEKEYRDHNDDETKVEGKTETCGGCESEEYIAMETEQQTDHTVQQGEMGSLIS